jgi:hypothetical protein
LRMKGGERVWEWGRQMWNNFIKKKSQKLRFADYFTGAAMC